MYLFLSLYLYLSSILSHPKQLNLDTCSKVGFSVVLLEGCSGETGLSVECLSDKTLKFKTKACSDGKQSKIRLPVA